MLDHQLVSRNQIKALAALYLALGALLAGDAIHMLPVRHTAAPVVVKPRYPAPPVIVRNDPVETVARIQYRDGDRIAHCTLQIDHQSDYWSLTC